MGGTLSSAAAAETPAAPCQDIIVHPDYDSPRWRRCPLELVFAESPLVTDRWLEALDSSLLHRVFRSLITDDIKCARDIVSLGMTCTRLHLFSLDEELWRQLCMRHFHAPDHPSERWPNWKRLYQFNYEGFMHLVREEMGQMLMGVSGVRAGKPIRIVA